MQLEEITGFEVMEMDLTDLKKGTILSNSKLKEQENAAAIISARHQHAFVDEMREFYLKGKSPTKKEFLKIFEKHHDKKIDDITDFFDQLDSETNQTFKVKSKKRTKGGGMVIELEKVNEKERIKLIKKVVDKLIHKLSPEQLRSMLEEGLRQNSDIKQLKKVDKELKKKAPEIESYKGCFRLVVNGKEIMVLR